MGKKNKLPDGWLDYEKVGRQVPGTRFIAFKVPLKEAICRNSLEKSEWFTPDILLETIPKLKLIINLTNTVSGRYYDYMSFKNNGVQILPLKCEGRGTLPPNKLMNAFYGAVDDFLRANAADKDALIGVHCTHGLNRTGLFICKYMVERMGMPPTEAIQHFQTARGHKIERHQYLHAITASDETTPTPEVSMNTVGKIKSKRPHKKEEEAAGFTQWCQQRQDNSNNYRQNVYNNHKQNGYNDHKQNGYNNHKQNGYNNQRETWNRPGYGDDYKPTSRYGRNNLRQHNHFRNNSPYSRDNSVSRRNVPPGQRRGKSQGRYYGSPLDNCYD